MKSIEQLKLNKNEKEVLEIFSEEIKANYPGAQVILFGSKAKANSNEWSDIDLLIVLNMKIDRHIRENIESIKYALEIKFDVVIGLIIKSRIFWNSSLAKAMPLHWNIDLEGIYL